MDTLSSFGSIIVDAVSSILLSFSLFFVCVYRFLVQVVTFHFRWRNFVDQLYHIGVQSLPVVLFSMTFVSLMMILEFSYHMKMVLRQDSLVPAFSTVMMIRELGPVFCCMLMMSRVGAGIAAEIGVMKVTEQLDALRLLRLDPVDYLTVPRWVASVIGCVSVAVITVGFGVLAGAILASHKTGVPASQFFNSMFIFTRFSDFLMCLTKAAVFGSIIPIVASVQGFRARGGSEGVGTAATSAVVHGSMLIIVADFVLTYVFYAI
jgi:phospholipid/cholesterol/gamma-HCH transport system permease protein